MASNIVDEFVAIFRLNLDDLKSGAKEADAETKRLRDSQKKTFDAIEASGRKTGESIRGITREVVGLGLAFLGARSIVGFAANLATSAANADRLGKTLGMNVRQIQAWRLAVKGVDGQPGEADSSLQRIQGIRMSLQTPNPDTDALQTFARLGVPVGAIQSDSPGELLSRLAGSPLRAKNPELYSNLLQQLGLSPATINLLMQGKDSVDKLLKQYEAQASNQQDLATETEKLQANMAKLEATLTEQIAPHLATIARWLNYFIGGEATKSAARKAGENFTNTGTASFLETLGLIDRSGARGSAADGSPGGKGNTRADRNNNPGNIEDGPFARRQPGYAGGDGRFARFATPEHGFGAMQSLLGGYLRRGKNTLSEIIGTWAPRSENNTSAYIAHVSRMTGIDPNQRVGTEHLASIARAMAVHEGYSGRRPVPPHVASMMDMHRSFARHASPRSSNVTIGAITVHTQAKDANGIARDMGSAVRRQFSIAQTDRMVNP